MKNLNIYIILLFCVLYTKIIRSYAIDSSKCKDGNCVPKHYIPTTEVLPSVVGQPSIESSNNSNDNDNEVDSNTSPNDTYSPSTEISYTPEVEKNDGFNNNSGTPIDDNMQNIENGNLSYNDDSSNQNNTSKQDNKSNKNESHEKSSTSNSVFLNKEANNSKYKYFLIFLLILTAIIIIIVLAMLIYKKKYLQSSKQVMMNVIDNEIRPGNFMEKIKAINMDNPYIINNNNHSNNNCPLFNFNMTNIINTNFSNSYDNENHFKNGYTVNKENNNNFYRTLESMNRGLKPPPTHDNSTKKKNYIKVKNNTPLVITTKRKSKNSDISNTQKTNSGSYSINRTSTEMSLALTPTNISHSSSNVGFGYKNNKLNKHTSVALTFGCRAVSDRESDSCNDSPNFTSPTRTSIMTNNQSNTSSRVSSQRSLTSFIANRISLYISGGKRYYRKDSEYEGSSNTDESSSRYTYYSKNKNYISGSDFGEISNSNTGSNASAIDKKSNMNVDTNVKDKGNDSKSLPSKEKSTEPELKKNGSEKLINIEHDLFASFLKDSDEKLDLTLSYGK